MNSEEIFTVAYLFMAAALIVLIDILRRKPIPIDTLRLFSAMFVLAYLIIPALSIIFQDDVLLEMDRRSIVFHPYTASTAFLVTLSYLGIYVGYASGRSRLSLRVTMDEQSRRLVFVLFLAVAFALALVYASQFGGIRYWISSAISARHLGGEATRVGAIAFIYKIIQPGAALALSIAFAGLCAASRNRRPRLIVFLLAFIYFAVMSVVHGGRGSVIFPLIGLLIIWSGISGRLPVKWLTIAAAALAAIIIFGKPLLSAIPLLLSGDTLGASDRLQVIAGASEVRFYAIELVRYILHPSNSLQAIIDNPQLRPRWFLDILIGLESAVPSRLIGIVIDRPPNAVEVNSALLTPSPDLGLIPGQLAAWVYAFNVPGLFIVAPIWGFLLRLINDLLINSARLQPGFWGAYSFVGVYLALYVQIGNPNHFVGRFVVLVVILMPLLPFLSLHRRRPAPSGSDVGADGIRSGSYPAVST